MSVLLSGCSGARWQAESVETGEKCWTHRHALVWGGGTLSCNTSTSFSFHGIRRCVQLYNKTTLAFGSYLHHSATYYVCLLLYLWILRKVLKLHPPQIHNVIVPFLLSLLWDDLRWKIATTTTTIVTLDQKASFATSERAADKCLFLKNTRTVTKTSVNFQWRLKLRQSRMLCTFPGILHYSRHFVFRLFSQQAVGFWQAGSVLTVVFICGDTAKRLKDTRQRHEAAAFSQSQQTDRKCF